MRNLIARLEEAVAAPNTPTLDFYIERASFRGRKWDKNSAADRAAIFDSLEGDLSPENLTWDGERPRSEVKKATAYLTKVMKELVMLDPTLKSRAGKPSDWGIVDLRFK
jgi:hypothetical protein